MSAGKSIQTRINLGMLTVNQALAERNEPEIKDPLDADLYRRIEERVCAVVGAGG